MYRGDPEVIQVCVEIFAENPKDRSLRATRYDMWELYCNDMLRNMSGHPLKNRAEVVSYAKSLLSANGLPQKATQQPKQILKDAGGK